jgi:hypothetical protein
MVTLANGDTSSDPRLGRLAEWDSRSDRFLIRSLLPSTMMREPRSYSWPISIPVLNQGQQGACVGFTCSEELAAQPKIVKGIDNTFAFNLYWDIQDDDEWSGSERPGSVPQSAGTSIHAAARLLCFRGFWPTYTWAKALDEVKAVVSWDGPMVAGTSWYTGMMETDEDGFVWPTGYIEGGHAWLVRGYNLKRRAFRCRNHWTTQWGIGGEFWVHEEVMDQLIHEQFAEFCRPLTRAIPKLAN